MVREGVARPERFELPTVGTALQLAQWEMEKSEVVGEMGMPALSIINEQDCKLVN
jgi:hypothetical protein